ncbi:MAG TPA: hypothetical protein VF158_07150 [Longimicrobiales bacterium]
MRVFKLAGLLKRLRRLRVPIAGRLAGASSIRPAGAAVGFDGADGVVETGGGTERGLHAVVRAMDGWFAHELAELERRACAEASAWAEAGLPRVDVIDDALDVEVALEKRCAELFRGWAEHVRTRVEDAMHDALRQAAAELLAMRSHLSELRRALREADAAAAALERARLDPSAEPESVDYGFPRFLSRGGFWALIALLVVVDLVANIPIFHELVPHESGEELLWQELTARSERYGLWAGGYRVAARLLYSPDITLLALGVIAFLVFSAHVFGEAMRRRFALREEDVPAARQGIRAHRRQWLFPPAVSLVAAGTVIAFLFISRERVERAALSRHEEAAAQVAELAGALARARAAGDLEAIAAVESQIPAARAVLADRERKLEYASGIAEMNVPILLLNVVLVLAAALASYLAKSDRITARRAAAPAVLALEERLGAARVRESEARRAFRDASERVVSSLARVRRLTEASPLRGWEAKAERLRGVVPLFRAENARVRGIDPSNIAAFRREPVLDIAPEHLESPPPPPRDLARYEAELERLHAELAAIDEPPRETARVEAMS